MRAPRAIFRSASLRLAGMYGVLFALSASALVFFLWWTTTGLLNRQVESAIIRDAQYFNARWLENGLPDLALSIQERMAEDIDDVAVYVLMDPLGQRIEGNLPGWPAKVIRPGTFYDIDISRAGIRTTAEVYGYVLPGGWRILVGRDVKGRVEVQRLFPGMLISAAALVAGLAALGALVMRNLFRRMVSDVSQTAAAIARGDLNRRVRRSGRGDEFDDMAGAINTMLDRIGRLMDGVKQVSNNIAHDLRTPITRARARLEDAAAHAGTESELRAAIERAVTDLDGITSVFQALLRISEVEAGSRAAAFTEVDLSTVLADLAELYSALAEENAQTLTLRVPDTLEVRGDRELIQQAVANLLDNAIKFSPHGGEVRLAAQPLDRFVEIAVTDQGPGIPPADRERATERFFRGEQARHTPGSGLGLALVQAVAGLHDGSLVLEDAQPGLRAVLRLSRAARPEGAGAGMTAASPNSHSVDMSGASMESA